jgi:hypothetical protein
MPRTKKTATKSAAAPLRYEAQPWKAADARRSNVDAAEYKHVVLYKRDSLYYVGLAKNLYWRLLGHTKNRHEGRWNRFAIFRIGRVRYLKDIETLLLRVAQPPGNMVSGHLHRDADLTNVLRRIQQDQTRRLKRIRKALWS